MNLLNRHRCTRIVHKALAEVRPQFRLQDRHRVRGVPHWNRVCFHGRHLAGSMDVDPALRVCWDADRLDLWRVGLEPDPALLCTAHARKPEVLTRANRMAEASS